MATRWKIELSGGLHAIGQTDRTIYPGAYPGGTAIRFERFELWTKDDGV
ncbi:MAG: hypothetical protein HY248_04510 [Fimbriimonas ginsengisoli]|nr:hypothetical protein [Fimbriimonas ginsengisoli]